MPNHRLLPFAIGLAVLPAGAYAQSDNSSAVLEEIVRAFQLPQDLGKSLPPAPPPGAPSPSPVAPPEGAEPPVPVEMI